MVIAEYLERKYYGPRRRKELAEAKERGRKKGIAEAKEMGRKKGIAEANAMFREWNARRLDAKDKGEPFDEPLPMDD